VPSCTPAAGQFSSSASVMPQNTDVGHALLNPNNAPLLPASSAPPAVAIVSLSHTHQVISLKLTNTNYLYWRMQMKPYLLGQGVCRWSLSSGISILSPLETTRSTHSKCIALFAVHGSSSSCC
jgi:hypothetical protein